MGRRPCRVQFNELVWQDIARRCQSLSPLSPLSPFQLRLARPECSGASSQPQLWRYGAVAGEGLVPYSWLAAPATGLANEAFTI